MAGASIPAADIERFHAAALEMADAARRIVKPALERGLSVTTKADKSLVTDVDHAIERRLRERIEHWFPDHGVIGEEYPPTRPESPSPGARRRPISSSGTPWAATAVRPASSSPK